MGMGLETLSYAAFSHPPIFYCEKCGLGADSAFAIHWGCFELTDEPLDQPPRDLALALNDAEIDAERFFVMRIGETRCY